MTGMAQAPASLTGKLILHYKVGQRLGSGGMGEVYLAEDTRLGRQVALKFLAPSAQRDEESRARLVREARAASLLRSPNIAVTYDLLEHGDSLFIAMEYVEGEVLSDRVARGPLPVRDAVGVAQQVADALDEAHGQNIIHRDIKSANLILTRRGLVKVLDFGLAKFERGVEGQLRDVTAIQITSPGLVMGTVAYMAPEQLLGADIDHRVDLFALGVVLYEMLAGRLPFAGETLAEVSDRILRHEPDALARFNYAVSPELDTIVRKALQKNPEFRYQSARELYIDLHNLDRRLEALESSSMTPRRPGSGPKPAFAKTPAGGAAFTRTSAGGPELLAEQRIEQGERSLAVMAFANVTREPADDWIGEGIAETVTSDLKNVHKLAVIGRAQIFELLKNMASGRDTSDERLAIELGRRLGAWWVVTGAYQRMGTRIRITAQVIEVLTASLLKTVKIDGAIDDIFELQDRIVFELSRSLDLKVGKAEAEAIARDETRSVEAFEAYSRGLLNMRQASRDSIDRAIMLFIRATELDPEYASAWASLGGALQLKGLFLGLTDYADRAESALRRAIALQPTLASAHSWLGLSLLMLDRVDEALVSLRQAVQLEPDNASTHQALARALWMGKGQVEEAIAQLRRGVALNPEGGYSYLQLSFLQSLAGDLDGAEASARQAIELQERAISGTQGLLIVGAHARLGYAYYRRRQYERAVDEYRRELMFLSSTDHGLRERTLIELHQKLSAAYEELGDTEQSARFGQMAIDEFERRVAAGADDPATRYYVAAVYARRGDLDNTLKHLALPLARLPLFTPWRLQRDPDFDRVRHHAAFAEKAASTASRLS
jgi:serine/threonine protein kinase/Flp pilus assembly protein TadD